MPSGNMLLSMLRPPDLALLAPGLEELTLSAGHVLCEAGESVRYCYFPRAEAAAALVVLMESGLNVESAVIGREGAVGGIVSQGHIAAFARAVVLQDGRFYRISCDALERAKAQSATVRALFARYADCLLAQVFQAAACNASHTIAQRAARWLSASVERSGSADVRLTQEQFAGLLGVGRSYASRVLQQLKAEGLVTTRRGMLRVRDLEALNARACSCNAVVRSHFETVLGGIHPPEADTIHQ